LAGLVCAAPLCNHRSRRNTTAAPIPAPSFHAYATAKMHPVRAPSKADSKSPSPADAIMRRRYSPAAPGAASMASSRSSLACAHCRRCSAVRTVARSCVRGPVGAGQLRLRRLQARHSATPPPAAARRLRHCSPPGCALALDPFFSGVYSRMGFFCGAEGRIRAKGGPRNRPSYALFLWDRRVFIE
jgi:hypothetical protein